MTSSHDQLSLPEGVTLATFNVPMRDGIRLATDVYRSSIHEAARLPVILERTPYGKSKVRESDQNIAGEAAPSPEVSSAELVRAGFVVVRQDCRGRGESEGTFEKYFGEDRDGADTLAWIQQQPWCDGAIAMHGVSYSAHVQLAAATQNPPGLMAMFMDSGGFSSAYEVGMRCGGAFEMKQVTWAIRNALVSPAAIADPKKRDRLARADVGAALWQRPWRAGTSILREFPEYENFLLQQWQRDAFDSYWADPAIYTRPHYPNLQHLTAMNISSWYDPYVLSTIENFHAFQNSYLIMGPWIHGRRNDTFSGDVEFGPQAAFSAALGDSYVKFRGDWTREALGLAPKTIARVQYFLMGSGDGVARRTDAGRLSHGGSWHSDTQWPPAASQETAFALDAAGHALVRHPREPARLSYKSDPENPVPTMGGQVTSGGPVMFGGGFHQSVTEATFIPPGVARVLGPLSERPDVVSFATEPLAEALTIAGPVTVTLTVAATAPDIDIAVKLIDEYPPSDDYPEGYAMNLTEGILRLGFREGFEQFKPLAPGEPVTVHITAPDTAARFAAGHRMRMDISSSNFPRFDVNPQTGERPAQATTTQISCNTLFTGGADLAYLTVHVVPQS